MATIRDGSMHRSPERGAARNGGRWNPVGVPALHTCERFETAWLEAQQGFPYKTQPLTLCFYEVDCGPLLDLSNPAIQERVRANPKTWMHEAWLDKKLGREPIMAWEVVEQLIKEGFSGIRVPSQAKGATARDINIVFWQ